MGIDVNRERAIDLALSQIEKQFGKGAIMKLREGGVIADIPALPTGSPCCTECTNIRPATFWMRYSTRAMSLCSTRPGGWSRRPAM